MDAMMATRPDLAYAIGVINCYVVNPRRKHWEAVKKIFRYLKGTKDSQLALRSVNSTEVEGYINCDDTRNTDNRKSTLGYIFTYGGIAISWS